MNKHPDDYVFGLDKNCQDKLQAKFDPERVTQCTAWLENLTGEDLDSFNADIEGTMKTTPRSTFHRALYDGRILCMALNKLTEDYEGTGYSKSGKKRKMVKKINKSIMPFKCRENITNYIEGCKKLGMKQTDCFVSQDLFEGDNIIAVIDQIYALGAISRDEKLNFKGQKFGVKFATENKREFTKEQLAAAKKVVPLQNAGSIAVEKSKGTDHIVLYGKAGTDLSKSTGGISQQNAGSIAVEKSKGTDHIVKYGIVGQEMGKSTGGVSQQNAGSIAVEKEKGTDHIVRYGIVGQEMGKSGGGISQQNAGSIAVEKEKGTDHIVRYGKVGQEVGESVGGISQQNTGSLTTGKEKKLDSISRALN